MKLIQYPKFNFHLSKLSFTNFTDIYNDTHSSQFRHVPYSRKFKDHTCACCGGSLRKSTKVYVHKTSGEQYCSNCAAPLKSAHCETFYEILRLFRNQLIEHNKLFADMPELRAVRADNLPSLHTNRIILGKRLRRDPSTIYRHIMRLIGSGAIKEKIGHGTHRNFELFINPDLLFISDDLNPDFVPETPYLDEQALQRFASTLRAKCILIPDIQEQSNKIISDVDKAVTRCAPNEVLQDQYKNNHRNSREYPKPVTKKQEKPEKIGRKKSSAGENFPEFRKKVARWIVMYAIHMLYTGKEIYDSELQKTIDYVDQYYFAGIYSFAQLELKKSEYRWRIDAVKRHCEKTGFKISVYPAKYFNLNNKSSGFINTGQWYKRHLKYLGQKHEKRKKLSDDEKLSMIIREFLKSPTTQNFRRCETYVKSNIPHLKADFYRHFDISTDQDLYPQLSNMPLTKIQQYEKKKN